MIYFYKFNNHKMDCKDCDNSEYTYSDISIVSLLVGCAVTGMLLCIKCKSISFTII